MIIALLGAPEITGELLDVGGGGVVLPISSTATVSPIFGRQPPRAVAMTIINNVMPSLRVKALIQYPFVPITSLTNAGFNFRQMRK